MLLILSERCMAMALACAMHALHCCYCKLSRVWSFIPWMGERKKLSLSVSTVIYTTTGSYLFFRIVAMSGWPSGLRRQTQGWIPWFSTKELEAFWSSTEGVGSNPTSDNPESFYFRLLLEAFWFCNKFQLKYLKILKSYMSCFHSKFPN